MFQILILAAISRTIVGKTLNVGSMQHSLNQSRSHEYVQQSQSRIGDASEVWNPVLELPDELRNLGIELLSSVGGVNSDFDDFLKQTTRPHKVDFGGGQSIVLVRTTSDARSNTWRDVREDTAADEYHILPNPDGIMTTDMDDGIMLDIGSNIGTQAIMAAKFHHRSQVIALEPLPMSYFYLRWNMHLNGVRALNGSEISNDGPSGILALNTAVTRDGRTVRMSIPEDYGSELVYDSELVTARFLQMPRRRHVDVQSTTLPSLLSKYKVNTIKLLKIDCEGCEHEVLPAIADRYICDRKRLQRIEGELHWAQGAILGKTTDLLRACGCSIKGNIAAVGDTAMFRCVGDESLS